METGDCMSILFPGSEYGALSSADDGLFARS